MPDLPTLTLTQAQFDRCLAVFGDAATYKAWLADQLRAIVIDVETDKVLARQEQEREAIVIDVETNVVP